MKLPTFFSTFGAIAIVFGLVFLLVPVLSLPIYGLPTEPSNVVEARYFGATLLPFGVLVWLARSTQDATAIRAILVASALVTALGVVVSAWSALSGVENAMAWSSAVIYGALLIGCVYFLTSGARGAVAAEA